MLFLQEWNCIIGSVTWPLNFLSWACGLTLSIISETYCGWFHLPRENPMPDQEGHSHVTFRFDWPPLLGPMTSSFSLAVRPALQDTDLFSLFPWSSGQEKQGRKFNGQIVYRSKGVRGVGQRQHRGNKWKKGRTLVPPCCVYCGPSVCPVCRAAPKACWSSSHVPLTFYLLPLGTPKLPFNCHPLELFVINLKGTQPEFWHPGSHSPFDFVF